MKSRHFASLRPANYDREPHLFFEGLCLGYGAFCAPNNPGYLVGATFPEQRLHGYWFVDNSFISSYEYHWHLRASHPRWRHTIHNFPLCLYLQCRAPWQSECLWHAYTSTRRAVVEVCFRISVAALVGARSGIMAFHLVLQKGWMSDRSNHEWFGFRDSRIVWYIDI